MRRPTPRSEGKAELKLSSSGDLELRVYSLGIPAMELTSRDGAVKSTPRLDSAKKAVLTKGLRDGLFWWDMKDFTVADRDGFFVLRNEGREVTIDKRTGLPVQQRLYLPDGKVLDISYGVPAQEGGLSYQSKMRIDLSRYSVTLQVKTIRFGARVYVSRPRSTATVLTVASCISVSLKRNPSSRALSQIVLIRRGEPFEYL